jgi:hypothetical protein
MNKNEFLIKIDGVSSIEEAAALQAAGATVIGVDLVADPRYENTKAVSLETGRKIRDALRSARLCVTLDPDAADAESALAAVRAFSPDFVQVPRYGTARVEWRQALLGSGIQVVLDGEEISYEDDPAWVESRLSETREWAPALVQVSLLNDIEQPWPFLTVEAPKAPGDLFQIEGIRHVTEQYDMLVSMEVSAAEINDFRANLPRAKGIFFRIGPADLAQIITLLQALRTAG